MALSSLRSHPNAKDLPIVSTVSSAQIARSLVKKCPVLADPENLSRICTAKVRLDGVVRGPGLATARCNMQCCWLLRGESLKQSCLGSILICVAGAIGELLVEA